MKHTRIPVASATPVIKVADISFNVQEIQTQIVNAHNHGAQIVSFPALCLTGATCGELFAHTLLARAAEQAIKDLLQNTQQLSIMYILTVPMWVNKHLYHAALVMQQGKILGATFQMYLPYSLKKWFITPHFSEPIELEYANQTFVADIASSVLYSTSDVQFGLHFHTEQCSIAHSLEYFAKNNAQLVFSIAASPAIVGKYQQLRNSVIKQVATHHVAVVHTSSTFGESTQDNAFAGDSFIAQLDNTITEAQRFSLQSQVIVERIEVEVNKHEYKANQEKVCRYASTIKRDDIIVNPLPFIPQPDTWKDICQEAINIQVCALIGRLRHINCEKVILGISGGLDSTLALIVCVEAFKKMNLPLSNIYGITMPGFGTSSRTHNNATDLMLQLGIRQQEISIVPSVTQHFQDIDHSLSNHDAAYENAQARERTQILMDISNMIGAIVVGTGDLSELALGWSTYNGDHMAMYGVNAGVPKTLVKHLVKYYALQCNDSQIHQTLIDIIGTPISPELKPIDNDGVQHQSTENLVGPYQLHDFFLYYFVHHQLAPADIYQLARKAFGTEALQPAQLPSTYEHFKVELYDDATIKHWLIIFFRRFFSQQFKRSCMPDGPQVTVVSLSPRGSMLLPSDTCSTLWLEQCEKL